MLGYEFKNKFITDLHGLLKWLERKCKKENVKEINTCTLMIAFKNKGVREGNVGNDFSLFFFLINSKAAFKNRI